MAAIHQGPELRSLRLVMAVTRAEFLLLDLIINATCRCHEQKSSILHKKDPI